MLRWQTGSLGQALMTRRAAGLSSSTPKLTAPNGNPDKSHRLPERDACGSVKSHEMQLERSCRIQCLGHPRRWTRASQKNHQLSSLLSSPIFKSPARLVSEEILNAKWSKGNGILSVFSVCAAAARGRFHERGLDNIFHFNIQAAVMISKNIHHFSRARCLDLDFREF